MKFKDYSRPFQALSNSFPRQFLRAQVQRRIIDQDETISILKWLGAARQYTLINTSINLFQPSLKLSTMH